MLTDEERKEIDHELSRYPTREAVALEALRIVQHHRRWVSDEALRDVADYLGRSPSELEGVSTFYNLIFRKPVGRHVILVCDSVVCWTLGYQRLRERLCARLGVEPGGTTSDGRFTLLPSVCLGACDHAPVLMVDSDTHFDVNPDRLDALLERYA
ncbi:MAG: NADH-quinone oxidoreductase subunit NuoE [Myxococcaceae bacterium]